MHDKALSSLKILDLTTLWPGPLATMLLADLGADVLRVDAPDRPDMLRYLPPLDADGEGAAWRMVGRNKKTITLNLKTAEGRAILRKLVQRYDIVVEQFRPGVLERLGVGYADLRAENPRLIWCAISSYGQTGPWRDRPGHDINFMATAGLASHMGRSGPSPWQALPGDVAGGTWPAVAGILAAALHRTVTGQGQLVDIGMGDGALFFNALAAAGVLAGGQDVQAGQGELGGGSAYDYYATRDGRWLAVGALEPKFWAAFCQAIDRPDLLDGAGDSAALRQALAETIAQRDHSEWQERFAQTPCCVEVVLTTGEALQHPQFRARAMVVQVPAGQAETHTLPQLGNPIHLADSPARYDRAAVPPGTDTDAVLAELALSADEVAALRASGAIG